MDQNKQTAKNEPMTKKFDEKLDQNIGRDVEKMRDKIPDSGMKKADEVIRKVGDKFPGATGDENKVPEETDVNANVNRDADELSDEEVSKKKTA